jgi:hypothetical protein
VTDVYIEQIYYSEQTRAENDRGFLELDNLANERPDWREYWPIRRRLLTGTFDDTAYYGFFSPKFKAKTNLDAATAIRFVQEQRGVPDVVLFSPFFDQSAFPLNVFVQGSAQHPNIMQTFRDSLALVAPGVDPGLIVMDSRNTVFCNFLVARPAFWREWLKLCEMLFAEAEAGVSPLACALNADTRHDSAGAPVKVFVIERIASLILATQPRWKTKAYNPLGMPFSHSRIAKFPNELMLLDALKIAIATNGFPQQVRQFIDLQQAVIGRC